MILRVIDKFSGMFLRDDFSFDEATEVGLNVAPSQGLIQPRWDFESECWVEAIIS